MKDHVQYHVVKCSDDVSNAFLQQRHYFFCFFKIVNVLSRTIFHQYCNILSNIFIFAMLILHLNFYQCFNKNK